MDRVDQLWELEQIKRLKSRYYRLQDQNRWEDWSQLFTEDCEVADPRDPAVTLHGPQAVAERTAAVVQSAGAANRAHRGTMPDLEIIDEQTARGTWALHCASTFDKPGAPDFALIYGYYTDEYRKGADGQWRISRMRYENDMTVMA